MGLLTLGCPPAEPTDEAVAPEGPTGAVTERVEAPPHDRATPTHDPVLLSHRAVAHALGGIDGVAFSNSLQALQHSLELGFRVLEVDLELDDQGGLVCFHTGSGEQITYDPERVDARPLFAGRFEVINGTELFTIMRDRPDMYLITDTRLRGQYGRLIRAVVDTASGVDPAILSRVIPHFYHPDHLTEARAIYPFERFIWKLPEAPSEEIIRFVRDNQVAGVVMPPFRFEPTFARNLTAAGALVYVHTINDPDTIEGLLGLGAHGVYTDFDTTLLSKDLVNRSGRPPTEPPQPSPAVPPESPRE